MFLQLGRFGKLSMRTEKRKKRHKKVPSKQKGEAGETELFPQQTSNIQTPRRDSGNSRISARKEKSLCWKMECREPVRTELHGISFHPSVV